MLFEPGTQNEYSNPGMAALSYAITASLKGGDVRTLLKDRLLDPLGVPESAWSIGYNQAYELDGLKLYANWGGATFTPRVAARIGQLMMVRGQWNGRELIRREVVKDVLTHQGLPHPQRTPTAPRPHRAWPGTSTRMVSDCRFRATHLPAPVLRTNSSL